MVESSVLLADGTVVPPGRRIPGKQLWSGAPARYVRDLTYDELHAIGHAAEEVCAAAEDHAAQLLPKPDLSAYNAAIKLRAALAAGAP